jgi:CHAT domain-containing protein
MAGAGAVCASLWRVDDEATSQLMQRFYKSLRDSVPPVEALRSAQLALLGEPRWAEPEKWAAFILMG